MAFIDQVQDLTSLTVSDNDELSQFLKDGVLDVTNRWLSIRPQDIESFGRESSETTSNASLNLNSARIISVIREDGTNNQWRNCRKISPALQYDVTNEESLNYASKINPAYMIGDAGKISVFPAPGADPNAFKVYYVNKDPVNSSGSALIHSHDDILYFPIDKVYLVVMYAGMKLLQANMGATTITDLSVTAVPPDVPTLSSSSVTFSQTAPAYTKPTITSRVAFDSYWTLGDFGDGDPGTTVVTAVPPDVPTQGTGLPTYEEADATVSDGSIEEEISKLQDYIEDEEDVELATAKVAEINARFQRASEEFNNKIKQWQTENSGELQRYQAEVQEYQAEVGAQVQEYTQKLQRYSIELNTTYTAWAKTESDSIQEYQADIQNELNEFNKESAEYQAQLQISLKNADFDNQEDARLVQKYQAEYAGYTAEVTAQVQEYTQNLQADGMGYQWLQGQYAALKAEYDQAFMLAAPKQQQVPQQRGRR